MSLIDLLYREARFFKDVRDRSWCAYVLSQEGELVAIGVESEQKSGWPFPALLRPFKGQEAIPNDTLSSSPWTPTQSMRVSGPTTGSSSCSFLSLLVSPLC